MSFAELYCGVVSVLNLRKFVILDYLTEPTVFTTSILLDIAYYITVSFFCGSGDTFI